MTERPAQRPAEPAPTLLDHCTCLRDGKHCRVCRLWDKHIAWFEGRPEPDKAEA